MDQVRLTRAVFTYLRKAFDTVDHELLLQKLWEYGMRAIELVWFKEYLSDWTQVVGYQSFFSDPCALPPDVPRAQCWVHFWFFYLLTMFKMQYRIRVSC